MEENIKECTNEISYEELLSQMHAKSAFIDDIIHTLQSPDRMEKLFLDETGHFLTDKTNKYPFQEQSPVLLPVELQNYFTNRLDIPFDFYNENAFLRYFLISSIKQSGEINSSYEDTHYKRHLFRMKSLLKSAHGLVADVGCDNPSKSVSLLPPEATYVGLEPFCFDDSFRLVAVAEYLPFINNSLDGIIFNTSLDHILDWRRAINEAHRALKPHAKLFISTLVWDHNADLIFDSVHFHHYREYELFGYLNNLFNTISIKRYFYKNDLHRYGLYLELSKK